MATWQGAWTDGWACSGVHPFQASGSSSVKQEMLLLPNFRLQADVWKPLLQESIWNQRGFQDSWLDWASILSSQSWNISVLWELGSTGGVEEKDEDPGAQSSSRAWFRLHPTLLSGCTRLVSLFKHLTGMGQCPM